MRPATDWAGAPSPVSVASSRSSPPPSRSFTVCVCVPAFVGVKVKGSWRTAPGPNCTGVAFGSATANGGDTSTAKT
jgi:hypothetical protein